MAIITPFQFFDGTGCKVFATSVGEHVLFFDDGLTMSWLYGIRGSELGDRRSWKGIRSAIKAFGATLTDDGCIEVMTSSGKASSGFAKFVSSLLAIDAWARSHEGIAAANSLIDEAALYLRAWRPAVELRREPPPLQGYTGEAHQFAFQQGGEYIDAISASRPAAKHEVYKLADLRASELHSKLSIRVVIDDRSVKANAQGLTSIESELRLLGKYATAWKMTDLIRASTSLAPVH